MVVGLAVSLFVAAPAIDIAPSAAAPADITTVVGGGNPPDRIGDGLPATQAALLRPWGVDEAAGELFITEDRALTLADPGDRVRRVDTAGIISTFAGGGRVPRDGGPATDATIELPQGVWIDPTGAMFVAESRGARVRRVEPGPDGVVNGGPGEVISTVAGNGTPGFSGDNGPATAARLNDPLRTVTDGAGHLFISDANNRRVRRVDTGGDGVVNGGPGEVITTVVGTGATGGGGDGGPATSAPVNPRGIDFDAAGNLLIAIPDNGAVRKVTPGADGLVDGDPDDTISTLATVGGFPEGLDVDPSGAVYVSVVGEPRVFLIGPAGTVTHVAGTGANGTSGDGGPALAASLGFPFGITLDAAGNLYMADLGANSRVRRITPGADGVVNGGPEEIITTFAGSGSVLGLLGDGGPATAALLRRPADVAAGPGGLYIAESEGNRIRRVDPAGIISTVAGGGIGDGLPATSASLSEPKGVVVGPAGVFIADCGNQRVRRVDRLSQSISTVVVGLGPASCPAGLDLATTGPSTGALFVADRGTHHLLRVDSSGVSTVVAGTGSAGFTGDGGAATAARLNTPSGVFVDAGGDIYVADTGNNRVRRIAAATGVITTIAGDGRFALGSDHVSATSASVAGPTDVVRDLAGNLVVTDAFNRIRRISPDGIITTIAGNGFAGFAGDGGPAANALLEQPIQIDVDAAGNLLFTDQGNNRVRRIEAGVPPPPPGVDGCGAVITKDTALTADIGPCPGDGLVIGANGITLDLKGHRIIGVPARGHGVGIRVADRTGVVIRGGSTRGGPRATVTGFDAGVAIIGGARNQVTGLVVEDNVGPADPDALFGDGIGVFFSPGNVISYNVVRRNGIYDGIGVLGIGSDTNTILGNTIEGSTQDGLSGAGGIGLVLNAYLDDSLPRQIALSGERVSLNLVRDNETSGISAIGVVQSLISDNTVLSNGLVAGYPGNGIAVQPLLFAGGDGYVGVVRNQVHGNARNGIEITSRSIQIIGNDASHNNARPPFSLRGYDLRDTDPTCTRNTWSGNVWGRGGFTPACTAVGGHPAPGSTALDQGTLSAARSGGGRRSALTSDAAYAPTRRGHPPRPG